ncbi:MAG: metallophosphoesterase, partial [Gemmataceae bacterium]|nr:metallophosphoesterase [Gemmataceae bacterium]
MHGCCDELEKLLRNLGYAPALAEVPGAGVWGAALYTHPAGRKVVFVGDLVDRGPRILNTLRLVRNMVTARSALCIPGNHDVKLLRKLRGRDVQITHGLDRTLAELDALPVECRADFRTELAGFLDGLISH